MLHKIFQSLPSGVLGTSIEADQLYTHGRKGRPVSSATKKKLWPESGTKDLNSRSLKKKPFNLANTPTLFFFYYRSFLL